MFINSLSDCEQERKHSIKQYLMLKKHAQQSRTNFLYELASQHASKGNQTISNIILRMNRNEEIRNSYRRIKNATKPFCGTTDRILINNDNDEQQEIISNEKEVIEKALSEENKQKFTMAYSSPFLQQPLISLLQQSATSIAAKQILHGTFPTSQFNISTSTKTFISHLKIPDSINKQSFNNTECSLQTAIHIRKRKEKKPIHLCHKDT